MAVLDEYFTSMTSIPNESSDKISVRIGKYDKFLLRDKFDSSSDIWNSGLIYLTEKKPVG
ncbi:unnamed protein product [Brugia pahangi]|uniref:Uncharacterized protein n=1 Tax=Brugia pahangi TaxID=6280 RepID=A0A0N4TLV1_BRUPA|nr:unnamed protein product [Brugia pahangi]